MTSINERYIGGETGRRGFFGGQVNRPRSAGLLVVGMAGVVATIMFQTPGLVLAAVAGAIVYAATSVTAFGSPLERIQARRRWRQRRRIGMDRFVPVDRRPADLEDRLRGGKRADRRAAVREWNAHRDWPDGVEGMNWLSAAPSEPGIMWHTPRGEEAYLTVAFPLAGQIQGLEGDPAVNAASERFGRLLASIASPHSLPSQIQMLTRVMPHDSARHEQWVVKNLDEDAPDELIESYEDVLQQVGRSGLSDRHYGMVRWDLTDRFFTAAARRGPNLQGWRALMDREIEAAWRRLASAGLRPGPALTAAGVSAMLRHLQMPCWPIDQADAKVQWPWSPSEDHWSYTSTTDLGPEGDRKTWHHRTARISPMHVGTGPRNPLWLLPILTQMQDDIIRTVSIEHRPVPASVARFQAGQDLASDIADLEAKKKKGTINTEELEAGLAAARARRNDMRPGRGIQGDGWAMHLTVSAESVDALTDSCALVTECLSNEMDIEALDWLDPDQSTAQAMTWPVVRGMRPEAASVGTRIEGLLAGTGEKEALS